MLQQRTRERIKEHNWTKLSNQSKFFKDLRERGLSAIEDLTLLAKKLSEDQLQEIFRPKPTKTTKREEDRYLESLLRVILEPSNTRTILLTEMMANLVYQKLQRELPLEMVNELSGDIGKTWTYAKVLARYADKPLLRR